MFTGARVCMYSNVLVRMCVHALPRVCAYFMHYRSPTRAHTLTINLCLAQLHQVERERDEVQAEMLTARKEMENKFQRQQLEFDNERDEMETEIQALKQKKHEQDELIAQHKDQIVSLTRRLSEISQAVFYVSSCVLQRSCWSACMPAAAPLCILSFLFEKLQSSQTSELSAGPGGSRKSCITSRSASNASGNRAAAQAKIRV